MRKKTERNYRPIQSISHFAEKLSEFGETTAYRYFDKERNLHEMSYATLSRNIRDFSAGLDARQLAGKRIAVIGETCPEWVISYAGIIAGGGIAIPMDRELEVSEIYGFLTFAEADAVICGDGFHEKFHDIYENVPTLKKLFFLHPTEGKTAVCDILEDGKKNEAYHYPTEKTTDRLAELLFTSGTTGSSKCVMLAEKNICSAVNSACETVDFSPNDRIVSVLPIHHTYELCIMLAGLNYGMNIAINDSVKRVMKNIALFEPTGLVLVPLYVETMNKKIWEEAKKTKKDGMLKTLVGVSKTLRSLGFDLRRNLFKQITSNFGGSLDKIICGGAPLNPELCENFSEFGIDIYEGYGITECAPLIAVNPYFAPKKGSVGPAVPACTVRIDYDHQNDKGFAEGEIQVKGDNVMMGYYKNEEATKSAFTEDGWFCTGDIGYMDDDDYIFITGRKKYVIVLSNGKNVFPEEIEEYLGTLPSVAETVVLGRKAPDSDDVVLTALIYPDMTRFPEGVSQEEILQTVQAEVNKLNKKLTRYKQIRKIELRDKPFEKTTSRKIKRHLVH